MISRVNRRNWVEGNSRPNLIFSFRILLISWVQWIWDIAVTRSPGVTKEVEELLFKSG